MNQAIFIHPWTPFNPPLHGLYSTIYKFFFAFVGNQVNFFKASRWCGLIPLRKDLEKGSEYSPIRKITTNHLSTPMQNWIPMLQRWSIIAFVKSVVDELPPRSAVLYFPSAIVLRIAFWIWSALSLNSKWRSIVTELNSKAVGFAKFWTNATNEQRWVT